MRTISKGKNICIYFTEDEMNLLEGFNEYCKKNYTSKSGAVKRHISDVIQTKSSKQFAFK